MLKRKTILMVIITICYLFLPQTSQAKGSFFICDNISVVDSNNYENISTTNRFKRPYTTYKVFTAEDPENVSSITTKKERLVFRMATDSSHIRLVIYDTKNNVIDDRNWELHKVNTSDHRWTVCSVSNDEIYFDIIFFSQLDSEQLVIFDYLNGAHTEITGSLDY